MYKMYTAQKLAWSRSPAKLGLFSYHCWKGTRQFHPSIQLWFVYIGSSGGKTTMEAAQFSMQIYITRVSAADQVTIFL